MPSTNYAYVNGRFVPENEATVSIFDRGFLYGDGCFETMRVYGGKLFRDLEHLKRLAAGLEYLGFVSPLTPEELRAACSVLIKRNAVADGVARIYITRGTGDIETPFDRLHNPTVTIMVWSRSFATESCGIAAIVSSVKLEPAVSGYKTGNRLAYILARREAKEARVEDAVLKNAHGHVVELTASNLFVVKSGELFTPPLSDGPLPGVTRGAVLALASEMNLPAHEHSFGAEFLEAADEMFATNSLMEVAPVVTWGNGRDVTIRLQRAYRALVARELSMPGP